MSPAQAASRIHAHTLLSAEDQMLSAKKDLVCQGVGKDHGIVNYFILLHLQGLAENWSVFVSLLTKPATAKRSTQRISFHIIHHPLWPKIISSVSFYWSQCFRDYPFYNENPVFFQKNSWMFRLMRMGLFQRKGPKLLLQNVFWKQ